MLAEVAKLLGGGDDFDEGSASRGGPLPGILSEVQILVYDDS